MQLRPVFPDSFDAEKGCQAMTRFVNRPSGPASIYSKRPLAWGGSTTSATATLWPSPGLCTLPSLSPGMPLSAPALLRALSRQMPPPSSASSVPKRMKHGLDEFHVSSRQADHRHPGEPPTVLLMEASTLLMFSRWVVARSSSTATCDEVAELCRGAARSFSGCLNVTAAALCKDSGMVGFLGRLWNSGAGRGTVAAALDEGFPTRVLTAALYEGISCWEAHFADRVFSALCRVCGGREAKAGRS
jgi:hypothetical protein